MRKQNLVQELQQLTSKADEPDGEGTTQHVEEWAL